VQDNPLTSRALVTECVVQVDADLLQVVVRELVPARTLLPLRGLPRRLRDGYRRVAGEQALGEHLVRHLHTCSIKS